MVGLHLEWQKGIAEKNKRWMFIVVNSRSHKDDSWMIKMDIVMNPLVEINLETNIEMDIST